MFLVFRVCRSSYAILGHFKEVLVNFVRDGDLGLALGLLLHFLWLLRWLRFFGWII